MIDLLMFTGLVAAGIRLGLSIGLAAIGESVSERSGVYNIGIEGIMMMGAFVGAWGAISSGSPWLGIFAATIVGIVLASVHALMVLILRVDQFVSGIGLVIFGFGCSSFLARLTIGSAPTSLPRLPNIDLGVITQLPSIGRILFGQSPLAYLAVALAIGAGYVLNRTAFGLEVRACGQNNAVAAALSVPVKARQAACILFGGAMAGLGGAYLSVVQVGAFVEGMVAGRGFVAITCVMLARCRPVVALVMAVGFGLAEAAQIRLQTAYPAFPYQFLVVMPYLAAIVVLLMARRRNPVV